MPLTDWALDQLTPMRKLNAAALFLNVEQRENDLAHRKIEMAHLGYLGAQTR